ncbi:mannosyl-oligosaccharide glucosidase GCS1-like isoform X2 [Durio zibethinus]|uniref:Mannosyl-oligosaccharide glucosidase n=1 Tax=Durio zibethinus TaxID=66656 RepID=A0A6P5XD31_DURZI|nr:mannosyl-oligosaccharide glucosidase GCS1-like isoform X2 [Durio zibethinus]
MTGGGRRSARSRGKTSTNVNEDEDKDALHKTKPNSKLRRVKTQDHGNALRILNANLKAMLSFGIVATLIIFFLLNHLISPAEDARRPRVVTPFPAPKIMDLPQFQGEHKESLYWGTYRPNVYFGIRARTPRSLIAGLMWIGIKDGRYFVRHVCQDSDGLSTYGWTRHNGRDFGHQLLVDQDMTLATSFLKSKMDGSGYGGDWAVRIDVQSQGWNDEMKKNVQLFFYLADEDGNSLSLGRDILDIHRNSLLASGLRTDIGGWQLHLKSKADLEVHYSGFRTPHIHNLSDLVRETLASQLMRFSRLQLPDIIESSSNILVFQISGRIPLETDIVFVSGTGINSTGEERMSNLAGMSLTNQLKEKRGEFDAKFENCFRLVDKIKSHDDFLLYWPAELYTAVPSRPVFPRGFLWDEGFHQLLIWRWDLHISLDIVGHWLDLINIDGWIPHEQILGAEALSKVPADFVLQHPSNGNPPTLFLVLLDLVNGIKKNKFTATESNEILSFLGQAFVRLEAWFQWFNTTQSGKYSGSYYWHGRDNATIRELNPQTLSSGLDDYPRASHPTEDERHVDLRCWMVLAADCMDSIGKLINKENKPGKEYGSIVKLLSDFDTLNQMHFDHASGTYFDFGNHTEKVRLTWKEVMVGNNHVNQELVREVLEKPELKLVPHVGYVSLFPFIARIIPPESWILEKQLDLISNQSILWTNYGLRSLAKTSSLYMKYNTEHEAPYWRGPIWMNMNYMILSSLRHYSLENGPYRDKAKAIHDELRHNLIRNVVKNYHQTGFLWEQYDQEKGKGQRSRLFTGWTSLVLLIMAEAYNEM